MMRLVALRGGAWPKIAKGNRKSNVEAGRTRCFAQNNWHCLSVEIQPRGGELEAVPLQGLVFALWN
jgi:hypothetical protein